MKKGLIADYRNLNWNASVLTTYGKKLGKDYYWKIYVSENTIRLLIHSVLVIQVGPDWWDRVVHPKIQKSAAKNRENYSAERPPRSPGRHDIYCTYLWNLGKILFDNKGYFYTLIPNVEKIIIALEKIRLPRNLVGHMNVLKTKDKRAITYFHKLSISTVKKLEQLQNFELKYP
jgi:hypothetical protein